MEGWSCQPGSAQVLLALLLWFPTVHFLHFWAVGTAVSLLSELHTKTRGISEYWGNRSGIVEAFAPLWDGNTFFINLGLYLHLVFISKSTQDMRT